MSDNNNLGKENILSPTEIKSHEIRQTNADSVSDINSTNETQNISTNPVGNNNEISMKLKDNSNIQFNISNLENLISTLKVDNLNHITKEIEKSLENRYSSIIEQLKIDLNSKNIALASAQGKAKDLAVQIEKYKGFEEFKKKSELYDELNTKLTNDIMHMSEELPNMFDANNDRLGRLQDLINVLISNFNKFVEDQNKKMDLEKQSLEENNKNLGTQLIELNTVKKQLEKKCSDMTKEKEDTVHELENKNNSLNQKEKDFSNLNDEYIKLSDELDAKKTRIKELEKQCSDSITENRKLVSEIETLNGKQKSLLEEQEQVKKELDDYKILSIDKLKEAHTLLINFTKQTRDNLRSVFPTDSFLGFISDGMQWERIAGIWEQTKRMIINESTDDINNMRRLFNILFDVFNEGYIEKPYILIIPKVGSKYDINEQIIKNNKPDGIINEVLLEGYISTKNNAVHKAVVTVN